MIIKNYKFIITNFALVLPLLLSTINYQLSTASEKLDVIVLDAGHGGKDPGAIGISGVKEKEVALRITLKLADLISKNYPNIKIILTRKGDEFPELRERSVIANQNNAKLFISIHANSKKPEEENKRGLEVYTNSRERFGEAVQITMKENNRLAFERHGSDETDNFIFSTLAQSGYLKQAETFSSQIEINFLSKTQLESRGCMNAGFLVLVGSSMPAVLVETGFLSDREDEKYLSSDAGQNAVASALFNAFVQYRIYYEM